MNLKHGDTLWQAFVHVSLVQIAPEVRMLSVVERQDGLLSVYDVRSGTYRSLEDGDVGDVYCRTEGQAWAACEGGLRRVARDCLRHADECRARKEDRHVVA
jgi:hypothetical protein